jgi:hypothetical protein
MAGERKHLPILLLVGFVLTLVLPLIIGWRLEWLQSKLAPWLLIGILFVSISIGPILVLFSIIKSIVQGVQSIPSQCTLGFFIILVWLIIPLLIYIGISPVASSSSINKAKFINDLLVVSTVLLGFTITIGGLRERFHFDKPKNEPDKSFLTIAETCLAGSLIIGFNAILWMLRTLAIGVEDQLLHFVVMLFSYQVSLIFVSSFAYVWSSSRKDEN